jgi:hypothetical protein
MSAPHELIPTPVLVFLLGLFNFGSLVIGRTSEVTKTILQAVLSSFEPKTYYFFDNYTPTQARRTTHVNLSASTAANVDWTYNLTENAFYDGPNMCTDFKRRSLPYLSIEMIGSDGKVIYDLTDFIEGTHIYSNERRTPLIGQVLEAWSHSSHIVLAPDAVSHIRIVGEDGGDYGLTYKDAIYGHEASAVEEGEVVEDLSGAPIDLSGAPVDLSGAPVDLSGAPVDLSGASVDEPM